MRRLCIPSLILILGLGAVQAAEDTKPLTPAEAIAKVDEQVNVELLVKLTKDALEKRGEIYLDSEEDYRDEKNLAIVITKTGAAKFKAAGVNDPAEHFKAKVIRVKGTVTLKSKRPRIEVDAPDQIEIVKTDGEKQ